MGDEEVKRVLAAVRRHEVAGGRRQLLRCVQQGEAGVDAVVGTDADRAAVHEITTAVHGTSAVVAVVAVGVAAVNVDATFIVIAIAIAITITIPLSIDQIKLNISLSRSSRQGQTQQACLTARAFHEERKDAVGAVLARGIVAVYALRPRKGRLWFLMACGIALQGLAGCEDGRDPLGRLFAPCHRWRRGVVFGPPEETGGAVVAEHLRFGDVGGRGQVGGGEVAVGLDAHGEGCGFVAVDEEEDVVGFVLGGGSSGRGGEVEVEGEGYALEMEVGLHLECEE